MAAFPASLPVVVAVTGATGAVYGVETVRALKSLGRPVHLIVTEAGAQTLAYETAVSLDALKGMADAVHSNKDLAAPVSSGSFRAAGMIVAPCSIKTLSGIANSFGATLAIRAADVMLKERRPLVLLVRETPLHRGHLELMAKAAGLGAVVMPPVPAFYHRPKTLDDVVRHTVGRALDQLGIANDLAPRWAGPPEGAD
jgi:4-hydroxy-3-polyprenylbenzoate decarboxylase